jgi:hypothetical protein
MTAGEDSSIVVREVDAIAGREQDTRGPGVSRCCWRKGLGEAAKPDGEESSGRLRDSTVLAG